MSETRTDLAVFEKLTPAVVFAPGGVDAILKKIAEEVRHTPVDISTKVGRENCASLAYKVARSKTALDKMGKDLGDTHYKSWKAITAERARIEKELDDLRDEVRQPLTDWENAEKDRVAGHEAAILALDAMLVFEPHPPSAEQIRSRLAEFEGRPARVWQEFVYRASKAVDQVGLTLERMLADAEKRESEAAELARLRAEQVAREQKERDDRIAAEAAERNRLAAIENERKRAAEEKAAADAATAAREADHKHRAKVNNEILAALAKLGFDAKDGKMIVEAIFRGNIPHVRIEY
jgi:septal ring factor EnvC (AmiA/AmiB activator)